MATCYLMPGSCMTSPQETQERRSVQGLRCGGFQHAGISGRDGTSKEDPGKGQKWKLIKSFIFCILMPADPARLPLPGLASS